LRAIENRAYSLQNPPARIAFVVAYPKFTLINFIRQLRKDFRAYNSYATHTMLALAERFDKRYSFPSTLLAEIMLWATADVKSIVLATTP
jgi:hypothetical protein